MTETIVAIATAAGRGGIGVLRLSGPDAPAIAARVAGPMPPPRHAAYRRFCDHDGAVLDDGLLLYFPPPHSYTGEAVVELQAHGGTVLLAALQRRLIEAGARAARPGEFTERAFLNGKLDLAQAEAVADLINAGTEAAARAARRSLDGELSARVRTLQEQLTTLRVHVEGALDFADEEVDWLADAALQAMLEELVAGFDALLRDLERGRRLTEGMTVVIAGRPNAGKSTLLNRLAAREAAIVTDTPGTTRDLLREPVSLGGVPVTLIDTAGLRDTEDAIEAEGVRRARAAMAEADAIIYLYDAASGWTEADEAQYRALPDTVVRLRAANKTDLAEAAGPDDLQLCARSGAGIETLIRLLAGAPDDGSDARIAARERHLSALQQARGALDAARREIGAAGDAGLAAEHLRGAQQALSQITGENTADALLGEIFARFCIGK